MDPATDWVSANVDGRAVQALNFDATNNYVSTTYQITGLPITIYSFVYTRSLGDNSNRPGTVFMRPTATGIIASYFTPARVGYTWNDTFSDWNGGPLWPINQNVLVAVTITSSYATTYAISRNGLLSGTNTASHGPLTSTSNVEIGRDNFQNNAKRVFDGFIYEAGIYNRVLSLNELQQLYQLGPGWLARPKQRASVLTVGAEAPSSFTASGAVTTGAATASGSATHTTPTYTGTSAVTTGAATCSGSATFTAPTYTAASSVTIAAATCSATGTFTKPVYTGTIVLTVGAATASGAATFVAPVYTASASVAVGATVVNVAGSVVSPTFTGTAALSVPAATVTATGTFSQFSQITASKPRRLNIVTHRASLNIATHAHVST